MSMLDGVSQCWLLGSTCKVDWEAWSAIGTVAAVFAAIFAPVVQRMFVRKRANRLFFFVHNGDVATVNFYLLSLNKELPEEGDSPFPQSFLNELRHSKEKREQLRDDVVEGVAPLAERSLDVTKWPAVDLDHTALLAVAVEGCRGLRAGATNLVDYKDEADFERRVRALRAALKVAGSSVGKVMSECNGACGHLFNEHVDGS